MTSEIERRPAADAETPEQVLAVINSMRADLARVEDPREAVRITKQADAVKYLARKADASADVQNQAAEVALRARRKAGELLAAVPREPRAGAGRPSIIPSQRETQFTPYQQVLKEAEIPRPTAARFEQLARLPDEKFEEHVSQSRADELTMAAALKKAARERQPEPVTEPVPLPAGVFPCVVIDPPWPIQKIERDERPMQGVALGYPVMDVWCQKPSRELDDDYINGISCWQEERPACKSIECTVGEAVIGTAADDCHLYLWTTHKYLPAALQLLETWGFAYQCLMTWRKNVGFTPFSWMYDTEHVIFARRGNLALTQLGLRLSFDAPVAGHSVKPDVFYERVIAASPGPRLEMFARRERDGFTAWGNEVASGT